MALMDNNEDALTAALFDESPVEAAPAQEGVRVVKSGDTLFSIAQEVGVPLQKLAEDNGITDVHTIQPGQEIRYTKPAPLQVDTDISAKPEAATEGIDIGDLTIEGETTTAVDAAAGSAPILPNAATENKRQQQLQLETSDGGTPTDTETISKLDFQAKPVAEASIDGPPVTEKVFEEPGGPVDTMPVNYEQKRQVVETTLPEDSKSVFKDVIDEIDELEIKPDSEDFYEKIADTINKNIDAYNTKISAIAEEKQKPTFEGWDKFLAVLGAAMGAYGSAMTGTPNFALKIMNDAIDRDAQAFLKSKEVRTKSLENQRMDLIMRRGELLQMAQNRTSQLMQAETFKLSKAEAKATIENLDKQLLQKIAENKQSYELVMAGMIKDFIISDASLRNSLNKENKKKYVNSFSTTDADGNTVIIPGYIARDTKTAEKLTEDQEMTSKALEYIAELDELYSSPEKYLPAWAGGKVSQRIDYITDRLELTFKRLEGMGANYTQYEQALIRGILPTSSLIDKFSKYKVKSASLKEAMIRGLKTSAKVRGVQSVTAPILASQENIEKFGGKKVRKN